MTIEGLNTILPEKEQDGILALAALNKMDKGKHTDIRKKCRLGRLDITFYYRSSKSWMGRFGGGWQWACGFRASGSSVILEILVCEVMLHIRKKEVKYAEGTTCTPTT